MASSNNHTAASLKMVSDLRDSVGPAQEALRLANSLKLKWRRADDACHAAEYMLPSINAYLTYKLADYPKMEMPKAAMLELFHTDLWGKFRLAGRRTKDGKETYSYNFATSQFFVMGTHMFRLPRCLSDELHGFLIGQADKSWSPKDQQKFMWAPLVKWAHAR